MIIFKHEIKSGIKSLLIWSAVIGGTIMLCLFLFPELKKEAQSLEEVLKSMGGFSSAFGMDRLNYGDLMGFYGIYAGSMLGIGGIFYAAILGTGMLSKEEKEHTAEFLLTHPISRTNVYVQKFLSMIVQMVLMNGIVILFSLAALGMIGETPEWKGFWLFHAAQMLMQLEILSICYGISAFLRKGSISIGLGAAALLYFLGLVGNITDKAEAVKYITPYVYADAAEIIANSAIEWRLAVLGMGYACLGLLIGYWKYTRKDIL